MLKNKASLSSSAAYQVLIAVLPRKSHSCEKYFGS